jgi:hypothetical protein
MEMEFDWNGIFYGKNGIQYVLTEFGYSLDYYEPIKNIVVEYDEPRHYVRNELRQKDVKRMDNIKSLLKCKFLRYNEKSGELKEY